MVKLASIDNSIYTTCPAQSDSVQSRRAGTSGAALESEFCIYTKRSADDGYKGLHWRWNTARQ
jgi:hypothetical protein